MSGSRWVITPSWLSGSLRFFFIDLLCILATSSSAIFSYVRSIRFLSFIVSIFAWNVRFVSLIILTRSLVFPILLLSSISLHCSLRKAFLSLLFFGTLQSDGNVFHFLLCLLLLFFSQLLGRPIQTTICQFELLFSWRWFSVLLSHMFYLLRTSIHAIIPWIK